MKAFHWKQVEYWTGSWFTPYFAGCATFGSHWWSMASLASLGLYLVAIRKRLNAESFEENLALLARLEELYSIERREGRRKLERAARLFHSRHMN